MSTFTTNGMLGALILVAVIYTGYKIATRKSPWNLPAINTPEWFEQKYLWSVLLVLGGAIIVWWSWDAVVKFLTFADMMKLAVPFVVVMAAFLILTFVFDGERAKQVRKGAWAAMTAFVVISLLFLYQDWDVKDGWFGLALQTQSCPPFSSTGVRECTMKKKPSVMTTDELTYAGQYEFCVVQPENSPFRSELVRVNVFRFWSEGEDFPIQYKMVKRDSLINGKCPSRF